MASLTEVCGKPADIRVYRGRPLKERPIRSMEACGVRASQTSRPSEEGFVLIEILVSAL